MAIKRLTGLASITALGLALAACGSTGTTTTTTKAPAQTTTTAGLSFSSLETPPSSAVSLQETGSSLLYPLFGYWIPAYQTQYPSVKVTAASTGSGTGIADAANGTVDIGASDAYLSASTLAATPSLLNIPLAISAQMINYNLPGVSNLKLSGPVISAIYQGKITTWNDPQIKALNPTASLPATKIVPLHRLDSSGDSFIFTQYLSKSDPTGWGAGPGFGTTVSWPAVTGALGETGNGGMVSGCGSTPGCIAYIGVSYQAQTQAANLGQAQLENASGAFESLTASTVAAEAAALASQTPANETLSLVFDSAATGYPIINYEYAIVNSKQSSATQAQAIKSLLAWSVDPNYGNSAQYLSKVGFEALPAAIGKLSLVQINSISAG